MSDLKLNSAGDLDITAGTPSLITGGDAVRQHIEIRLRFFLGEWFRDQRVGVAYHQTIFKKGTPITLVRSIIRRTITQTPGIRSVSKFETSFDGNIRKLTIDVEGLLEPGVEPEITGAAPFQFSFSPFILLDQVQPVNPGIT